MSVSANKKSEIGTKLLRLRERMTALHVEAVTLNSVANTAWLTAGATTYVNVVSDTAASSIIVMMDRA